MTDWIAAASGLIGVAVGSATTIWAQRSFSRTDWARGMRTDIFLELLGASDAHLTGIFGLTGGSKGLTQPRLDEAGRAALRFSEAALAAVAVAPKRSSESVQRVCKRMQSAFEDAVAAAKARPTAVELDRVRSEGTAAHDEMKRLVISILNIPED